MCNLCKNDMTWVLIIIELIPDRFFSKVIVKLPGVFNPRATTGRDAERYFHILHYFKTSAAPCQTFAWHILRCSVFVLTVCTVQIGRQASFLEAGGRLWLRSPVLWKNLNSWWDRWPMGCSAGTVPYNCKTIPLPHCTAPTHANIYALKEWEAVALWVERT